MKIKNEAIVSPPERPKGRPAVYWFRIEAPCRGCLKIARDVEQMLLGRGCKFEITSNREMLARIRRGLRLAISGESKLSTAAVRGSARGRKEKEYE